MEEAVSERPGGGGGCRGRAGPGRAGGVRAGSSRRGGGRLPSPGWGCRRRLPGLGPVRCWCAAPVAGQPRCRPGALCRAHPRGSRPCWGEGRARTPPPRPGAPISAGARRQVTAGQLRERGNALFQAGDHAAALAAYTRALSLCDAEPERAVLHRNRAACYLKLVRAGRPRHRGACGNLPGRPGLLGLRGWWPPRPSRLRQLRACAGRPWVSPGRALSGVSSTHLFSWPCPLSCAAPCPWWAVRAWAGRSRLCLCCVYALGLLPRQSQGSLISCHGAVSEARGNTRRSRGWGGPGALKKYQGALGLLRDP